MKHLSTIELEDLQVALEAELAALEEELQDRAEKIDGEWVAKIEEEGGETDPLDAANNIEEYGENVPLVSELAQRELEIKSALERMKGGTYGLCQECNMEIATDRLESNPAASTCIKHTR